MTDAIIDNQRFKAPNLRTHFEVLDTDVPYARITRQNRGKTEIVDGLRLAPDISCEQLAQELRGFVLENGFRPA